MPPSFYSARYSGRCSGPNCLDLLNTRQANRGGDMSFRPQTNEFSAWLARSERRLAKARLLLAPAIAGCGGVWADLGCGDGVFTYLLATMLAPESQVYAVDRDGAALVQLSRRLAGLATGVTVHTIHADFTGNLSLAQLDGILMANSLHFVRHKEPALARLIPRLIPGGRLVIVEYNANRGNSAVPHPLADQAFLELADASGLASGQIVARTPSSFLGEMFTGLAVRPKE